ncbi:MAG TPA: antibiotic biosynthesis monooxygenase [Pseudonocardia sp.]|nr:antibiotic biosynthesis monooxygenase [Pseudonocardia sp.]
MTITVRAELRSRPGRREEFAQVATELAEAAATEPGTLRYDWYTDPDPDVLVVLEEYTDTEAGFAHNRHCADLLARVMELAEITSLHMHGDIEPELADWIAQRPFAHAHPPLRRT